MSSVFLSATGGSDTVTVRMASSVAVVYAWFGSELVSSMRALRPLTNRPIAGVVPGKRKLGTVLQADHGDA